VGGKRGWPSVWGKEEAAAPVELEIGFVDKSIFGRRPEGESCALNVAGSVVVEFLRPRENSNPTVVVHCSSCS
jgi:hypothetical protein